MSAQEAEITERFEVFDERPPFQPPVVNEDIKLSRFLFTAANLITPDIARDRPHMKSGGLNVFNPCLDRQKDFVRRGRLTPLLMGQHIPIPAEDAPPGDSSYFNVPLDGESLRLAPSFYEQTGMMSRLAYPGQQIMHILEGSPNGLGAGGGHRLGIVEIPTLKGHEYKLENIGGGALTDKELWKIQKAIFPGYPDLPFALRPFTDLVRAAIDANTGDIRSIAEEVYPSCVQFEGWAVRRIEKVHQDMGQAAVKGYASPYEQIDIVVLDQLEMRREDEHFKRSAQQAARQAQQPALSHEAYLAMKAEVIAELKAEQTVAPFAYVPDVFTPNAVNPSLCAICGFDKMNLSAHPEHLHVNESTMSAASIETGQVFTCPCGKEAGSLAGLKSHQRSCDQATSE